MPDYPQWAQPIDDRFALAFSVRVDGKPHGKGSVRVVWTEDGPRGRQAPKSRKYEELLAMLCRYQQPKEPFSLPLSGPLICRVLAVKQRPKRVRKADQVPYGDDGRLMCPVIPDWDNIGKSAGDGLKKGGVMRDDAQISDGRSVTLYGRPGEKPFIEVYIFALLSSSAGDVRHHR